MVEGKMIAGMEKMLPRAFDNMSNALVAGNEGKMYDDYDRLVEEEFDAKDAWVKAIGFSSMEYAAGARDYWTEKRLEKTAKSKDRVQLRNYALTMLYGSAKDKREARRDARAAGLTSRQTNQAVKYMKEKHGIGTVKKKKASPLQEAEEALYQIDGETDL